jgi:hypothetical protein
VNEALEGDNTWRIDDSYEESVSVHGLIKDRSEGVEGDGINIGGGGKGSTG